MAIGEVEKLSNHDVTVSTGKLINVCLIVPFLVIVGIPFGMIGGACYGAWKVMEWGWANASDMMRMKTERTDMKAETRTIDCRP